MLILNPRLVLQKTNCNALIAYNVSDKQLTANKLLCTRLGKTRAGDSSRIQDNQHDPSSMRNAKPIKFVVISKCL